MDSFKKIACVKGLIIGMEEELYKYFQKDNLPKNLRDTIINEYYKSIVEFLNKEETNENT